jgi:hypothetical protein
VHRVVAQQMRVGSTGPRSLMPTTSMSVRPDSAMARRMLRPMRPNPLIPTRMVISHLQNSCGVMPREGGASSNRQAIGFGDYWVARLRGRRRRNSSAAC